MTCRADVGIGPYGRGDGLPQACGPRNDGNGAWQYVRLFRHLLNRNYFQVWAGDVPQGRQPYLQKAQAEPSPERFQVLQVT